MKNIYVNNKPFVTICLLTIVLMANPVWSLATYFTDWTIHELRVLEVNIEEETVTMKSPDGSTAILTVGDVIGKGLFTIKDINEVVLELESYPNERGKTLKGYISAEPVYTLEDLTVVKVAEPMPALE